MIQSMTGFGKAIAEIANKKVTVEVKSVNSKQLDLMAKVCAQYREREMDFRQIVQRKMQRGKVELVVTAEALDSSAEKPHINTAIISEYYKQLDATRKELGMAEFSDQLTSAVVLQTLLRFPDAIHVETPVIEQEELDAVVKVVEQAVDRLVEFRVQEGQSLYRVFSEKVANIRALLAQVEPYEKDRTERIRQNLLDRLEKLPVDYDKNRLEQEMIYYIEKLDSTTSRSLTSTRRSIALSTTSTTSSRRWMPKWTLVATARNLASSPRRWAVRSTPLAPSPTRPKCSASSSR